MSKKIQVVLIPGGQTFKKRKDFFTFLESLEPSLEKRIKWSGQYIEEKLGKDFEILRIDMPIRENAKYREWKLYFEKFFPYFRDNIILIGRSLGGIFLAKYLSEEQFPRKILASYLIAPPFDNSLPKEDLLGGFRLKNNLSLIEKNSPQLTLVFSADDDIIPLSQAEAYREKLKKARIIIYPSKNGHFLIEKFPELIKMLKADQRRFLKNNSR